MSLIVLYFLHNTSVLSFNIDVFLTLSILVDELDPHWLMYWLVVSRGRYVHKNGLWQIKCNNTISHDNILESRVVSFAKYPSPKSFCVVSLLLSKPGVYGLIRNICIMCLICLYGWKRMYMRISYTVWKIAGYIAGYLMTNVRLCVGGLPRIVRIFDQAEYVY